VPDGLLSDGPRHAEGGLDPDFIREIVPNAQLRSVVPCGVAAMGGRRFPIEAAGLMALLGEMAGPELIGDSILSQPAKRGRDARRSTSRLCRGTWGCKPQPLSPHFRSHCYNGVE